MTFQFEEGKFYTDVSLPGNYPYVSKAVKATVPWGRDEGYYEGLSPYGCRNSMKRSNHRPATEAEIASFHSQRVSFLWKVWASKKADADGALEVLKRAEEEERRHTNSN